MCSSAVLSHTLCSRRPPPPTHSSVVMLTVPNGWDSLQPQPKPQVPEVQLVDLEELRYDTPYAQIPASSGFPVLAYSFLRLNSPDRIGLN